LIRARRQLSSAGKNQLKVIRTILIDLHQYDRKKWPPKPAT
jgi:hypothetical protein